MSLSVAFQVVLDELGVAVHVGVLGGVKLLARYGKWLSLSEIGLRDRKLGCNAPIAAQVCCGCFFPFVVFTRSRELARTLME